MNLNLTVYETTGSPAPAATADKQVRVTFSTVGQAQTVSGPFTQAAAEQFASVAMGRTDVTRAEIEEVA